MTFFQSLILNAVSSNKKVLEDIFKAEEEEILTGFSVQNEWQIPLSFYIFYSFIEWLKAKYFKFYSQKSKKGIFLI